VTGASGLLGAQLVPDLTERGAKVICLIRDDLEYTRLQQVPRRFTSVHGDVRDNYLLQRVLAEYEIDTVFHLAAQPIVRVAHRNPAEAFDVNLMGTVSVLEACRHVPVERIVVASTDKVYGVNPKPCDEDAPLVGRSPYEASKVCADVAAQSYARQYDMPIGIARCGNLYGPGDLNWNRIIPGTIRSIANGKPVIVRSDGTPVHDYFYVADAADAYMVLAEKLLDQPGVRIFNFGGGVTHTVREVVDAIRVLMNDGASPAVYLNEAKKEIPHQELILDKAKRELGWKSECAFERGIGETVEWYQKYFKREGLGCQR
jgi:CDP-glucose 4,6-dehydratase